MIGVFDSGIGGLTVLKEIAARFPALDLLYLGDTARVPYGTKSPETVVRYSFEAAHFLGRRGIELLVVACNTSSALALAALERELPIPVIGVVEAGARRAAAATKNRSIGVIGTPATIRSRAYTRAIHAIDGAITVHAAACPLFVPLAEEGWTDNAVARETASIYLDPLARKGIDTLVLGCTHYPVLRRTIAEVMGAGVTLVDSAEPVAEEVGARLGALRGTPRAGEANGPAAGTGSRHFFVTDNRERFKDVGARFLGHPIERLELADIVGE